MNSPSILTTTTLPAQLPQSRAKSKILIESLAAIYSPLGWGFAPTKRSCYTGEYAKGS